MTASSLERDIRQLQDIEEIKRLKYRYLRCLDTADVEEAARLFHKDVTTDLWGGIYRYQIKGRDAYVDMIKQSFHAEFISTHTCHHPEIDILGDTEATGLWYLTDSIIDTRRNLSISGTALYRDRYIKEEGRWLIIHSGYERIFEVVNYNAVKPDLTAHYLAQHGMRHAPGALEALPT
jgi:SnoaL-like domain